MDPILLLCLIMSMIFMAMPLIILIIGLAKKQKAILTPGLIWFGVNVILVILLWILYGTVLSGL